MSESITKAISVLCDCRDALRECDRDGDYKLIGLIDDTCAALSKPAPLAGEVTDEQIDALIKKHSRNLYSSSQLDWEVAEFHRFGLLQLIDAILALRPQAVPMTPEQRDYVSVPISLIRRAQNAINWHLEPNSPDEHEATMLELTAIGWPNGGPGITAKAEGAKP